MKNSLLKRLIRDPKSEILHSSGYAKTQNGSSMGVASTESFAKRRSIDRNRKVVRCYGSSQIVNEAWIRAPRDNSSLTASKNDTLMGGNDKSSLLDARKPSLVSQERAKREARFGTDAAIRQQPTRPVARKNPGISR